MANGSDIALRLMIVDDSVEDAEAIVSAMRNAGIAVRPLRPASAEELGGMLGSQAIDLVLAAQQSKGVPLDEELQRTVPVITALAREYPDLLLSIDTVKAAVAHAALDAGAAVVNDVSGLRLDPAMAQTVAAAGAGLVLMHSRGGILELASYRHAQYPGGVTADVVDELRDAVRLAREAGIPESRIAVDPGLGFSKTVAQNLSLLDELPALLSLGRPILVGPSRKRFLNGAASPDGEKSIRPVDARARDTATAAACVVAWERGARLFRVHDVANTRDALALAQSLDQPTDSA